MKRETHFYLIFGMHGIAHTHKGHIIFIRKLLFVDDFGGDDKDVTRKQVRNVKNS